MDNITSSMAMSPCQVFPAVPTNVMVTESPENPSKDNIADLHWWGDWSPDLDHSSWSAPVLVDRAITFNVPIPLAPAMW
jgi:hypothetical protein